MEDMSEPSFGTWTVPESPVDIEYSMVVIDEIRQAVAEGFQRLSRGGIEVGGVLYGTVAGRRLRIMAMREIACEHARGPTFHLSDNDHALLTAQLERERDDPRLSGMVPVGWYLSHTRSEITLQQSDLDTYHAFFPEPFQVTMVIRPGRAQSMRAGFFVRESDGTLKTDHSYHDFAFPDRLAGMFERASRERNLPPERRGRALAEPHLDAQPLTDELSAQEPGDFRQAVPAAPEFSAYPSDAYPSAAQRGGRRKVPWLAIAIVIVGVILASVGLRYFGPKLNAAPIALVVNEHDGQLQIQWNHASRSIATAASAWIEIADGTDAHAKRTIDLSPKDLAAGSFVYARKTGDVQVRMVVVTASDGQIEEGSRFLGNPPPVAADPAEAHVNQVQQEALQDEITRLRERNTQQTERIQRLERTLTILRSRLGITQTETAP
jgi:JAB1/Mov34/MPN/PAD-1 ubiquitin protease